MTFFAISRKTIAAALLALAAVLFSSPAMADLELVYVAAPIPGVTVRVSSGDFAEDLTTNVATGSLYTVATMSFSPFASSSNHKVLKYELSVPEGYDFAGYCKLKVNIAYGKQPYSPEHFETEKPISTKTVFESDYIGNILKSFTSTGTWETGYQQVYPVYVNLIPKRFVLSFDSTGGSACASQDLVYDAAYELPEPKRIGYVFEGWYTQTTGDELFASSGVAKILTDTTLYARWRALTPAISFDPQGGTVSPVSMNITYGSEYQLPTPTRENYTFDGWYTAESGGTKVDMSGISSFVENISLYARWSKSKLTVKFDPNNEDRRYKGTMSDQIVDMEGGFALSPNKFEIPGYQFLGWTKDPSQSGGLFWDNENLLPQDLIDTNGGSVTLYAMWEANTYTVTLMDGAGIIGSISVTFGSPYGELLAPTREGYRFGGWFTSSSGGVKISADTEVTTPSNHRLYALWTAKTYSVTYNSENCEMATAPQTGTFAQQLYVAWTPHEQEGYTFKLESAKVYAGDSSEGELLHEWENWTTGYFNMAEEYYESVYIEIVYRKTPNKYVVRFDSDGGESCTSITVVFNAPYGELPCPGKTDCVFDGWFLGEAPISETNIVTTASDHLLTATWKPETYTISFDADGGTGEMPSITANRGEYITLPTNAYSRVGYVFYRWTYGSKRYTDGAQVKNLANSGETATLTAKWESINYTIKYDANWSGAAGLMNEPLPDPVTNCSYEDEIEIAVDWSPNMQGVAKFLGWSLDAKATVPTYKAGEECLVSGLTTIDGDEVVLYAVWEDTLSELSRAVGCDNANLQAEPSRDDKWAYVDSWHVCESGAGIGSGEVMLRDKDTVASSILKLTVNTNGTLVFVCRMTKAEAKGVFRIGGNIAFNLTDITESTRYVYEAKSVNGATYEWRGYGPEDCFVIESLRWYPGLKPDEIPAENPEPTEADAPTISGDFSFVTDERFDYVIWKKHALTDDEWIKHSTVTGDGKAVKLPMFEAGETQGFFKVEVIQRNAQ